MSRILTIKYKTSNNLDHLESHEVLDYRIICGILEMKNTDGTRRTVFIADILSLIENGEEVKF